MIINIFYEIAIIIFFLEISLLKFIIIMNFNDLTDRTYYIGEKNGAQGICFVTGK